MKEITIDGVTYALVPKGTLSTPATEQVSIGDIKGLYSEHFELTLQTNEIGDDRWFGHSIAYNGDRYWCDSLEWIVNFLEGSEDSANELSPLRKHELKQLLKKADELGWLKE